MNLLERVATKGDADAIRALVLLAYARWVPVINREPRPMLADYHQAVLRHRFDLLIASDRLVALIETDVRNDHLWIENIAVHPEYQRQGLGHRLLAQAETLATERGLGELRLLTNAAFESNIRLYRSLGYAVTHTEPFGTGTTLFMRKVL